MLNQIIEAERTAQRVVGDAKAQRDNLPNELRTQWEALRADYIARAERRLSAMREQEEAVATKQIEQLDERLREDLQRLEDYFCAHRDEMAKKLFALITGV